MSQYIRTSLTAAHLPSYPLTHPSPTLPAFSPSTPLQDYIDACADSYLQHELAPERKSAMQSAKDIRVDICLYFIPPHHLRKARETLGGVGWGELGWVGLRFYVCFF